MAASTSRGRSRPNEREALKPPPGPTTRRTGVAPRGAPSAKSAASRSAGTCTQSPPFDQYRQATSSPESTRARAHCSPVSTLTSCSGEGPPKITAVSVTARSLARSRVVIRQVVLVQDCVSRSEVVLHPCDRLLARSDGNHLGGALGRAVEQGASVDPADDHQVGGDGSRLTSELTVLVVLAPAQLHHARGDDHPPAAGGGDRFQCLQSGPTPGRIRVVGVVEDQETLGPGG